MSPADRGPSRGAARDALLCLALFAAAVAYLTRLPRLLGPTDESIYYYIARQLLAGEVPYRDLFEIIPPGAHYLLAGVFAVFGADAGTAKAAAAVVHGAIAVVTYLTCRQLGVRRCLAAVAAVAHLAVDFPAWPYGSPHWIGTLLGGLLALATLARPWRRRAAGAALPGLLAGALIAVQHQKGVVFAAAAALCLLLDRWLGDRAADRPPPRLAVTAAWFAAGAAVPVAPLLAVLLATAGWRPVYAALVEFPLASYRPFNRTAWGAVSILTAPLIPNTFPRLLRVLPAVLIPWALHVALIAARDGRGAALFQRATLAVFAAAAAASIAYFPDFIHIAFIAPIFYVVAADAADAALRAAARRLPAAALAAPLLAAAALAAMAGHLRGTYQRLWAAYPVAADTAFGRVDLPDRAAASLVERARALAAADPGRRLFCYPGYAALYLMTGTDNPTPFEILLRGYSPPEHFRAALAELSERPPPLVVVLTPFVTDGDPVVDFVHQHYDPVPGEPYLWVRRAQRLPGR